MDAPAISQKANGGGHLYEGSKYAHFSQITEHNKHLFPLFPRATSTTVTLEAGDCLFIPKKWWHWVKSYASNDASNINASCDDKSRCISINFWFPSEPRHENRKVDLSDNPAKNLVIQQILPQDFTSCSTRKWKILGDKTIPMTISHAIDDWDAFRNWTDEYLIAKIDPAIPEGLWLFLNEGACAKRISLADFIARYAPDRTGIKQNDLQETRTGIKQNDPQVSSGASQETQTGIKQNDPQTKLHVTPQTKLHVTPQETYAYLITPSDYEPRKEKHNAKILDILKDDFHAPFPSEMVGADANFWMNFGRIDTGLHYDDDDGVLCVVKGRKVVTLYHPLDSEFLYPYPLQPIKLVGHNKVFHYNLYIETPIEITSGETSSPRRENLVTSAQLLEVCLHRAPNVALIARKLQDKFGAGRIVYGIKNMGGVVKYEFYFYGLDKSKRIAPTKRSYYASPECNQDFDIETTLLDLFPQDHYVGLNGSNGETCKIDKTNLCIWSIDLTEEDVLKGSTPHLNLYYVCTDSLNIPIVLAERTYHKDGSIALRSISYTGECSKILQNVNIFRAVCLSLGLADVDIIRLIEFMNKYLYKAEFMSMFNKGTEVGLYFYGIAYQAFVDFLMRYDYPVGLITLVVDHPHEISQLKLEIGFHFTKSVGIPGMPTDEPTRTAFYGLF